MTNSNLRKTKYNPKDFDTYSEDQKLFIRRLYQCIRNMGEMIKSPPSLSYEEVKDSITYVQYTYPELFYFSSWRYREAGKGWEIFPDYRYSLAEVRSRTRKIEAKAAEIIQLAKKAQSVYDRCGIIHNYIVRNCVYDDEARGSSEEHPDAYTIEGFFFNGKAVCLGVALTFKYLCDMLDISTIVVSGRSFKPNEKKYGLHAWNIVRSGPYAAQIDVTWDMCLYDETFGMRYDYYFLSDIEMLRDHQYIGYPDCRRLNSNYYERSGTQFDNIDDLDKYIERQLSKGVVNNHILLHFKIIISDMSSDDLNKHIYSVIGRASLSWRHSVHSLNASQRVYSYRIEL